MLGNTYFPKPMGQGIDLRVDREVLRCQLSGQGFWQGTQTVTGDSQCTTSM